MGLREQRHVVKTQILELKLSSAQSAFEFQQQISHIYHTKIIPLLDRVFSQFCPPELSYRIEHLTLDLGSLHRHNLETELIAKVEQALRSQLSDLITVVPSQADKASGSLSRDLIPTLRSNDRNPSSSRNLTLSPQKITDQRFQFSKVTASRFELITHFLQTGILPWWAKPLSKSEIETLLEQLIDTEPPELKAILVHCIKQENSLKRLISQFSDKLLLKIAHLLSPNHSQFITDWDDDIQVIVNKIKSEGIPSQEQLRLQFWRSIYLSLALDSVISPMKLAKVSLRNMVALIAVESMTEMARSLEQQGFHFKTTLPNLLFQLSLDLEPDPQDSVENVSLLDNLSSQIDTNANPLLSSAPELPHSAVSHTAQELFPILQAESTAEPGADRTLDQQAQVLLISNFIETGILPWWAKPLSQREIETLLEQLIDADLPELKVVLVHCIKQENSLKRLISQFSDKLLLKIAHLLSPNHSQFITDWDDDIQAIVNRIKSESIPSQEQLRLQFWRSIYLSLALDSAIAPMKLAKVSLRNMVALIAVESMTEMARSLEQQGFPFKTTLPNLLFQLALDLERDPQDQTVNLTPSINPEDRENLINPIANLISFAYPKTETKFSRWIDHFTESDEIYIENAGLILLWPFLERFFETIQLVTAHNFIDRRAAEKAALLLQFAVEADTEFSEHFLPLNKLLCGLDLLESVPTNLELSALEKEEMGTLLSAVIQNWRILKNTSIDGLRTAFLQREGILRDRHGDWLLQVQQKDYDILLDRLPWNIHLVKLPWMNTILHVEW